MSPTAQPALPRKGGVPVSEQAVEIEFGEFLEGHSDLSLADGRRRVVRNGSLPEREVQTGVGSVSVKVPRARDRAALLAA